VTILTDCCGLRCCCVAPPLPIGCLEASPVEPCVGDDVMEDVGVNESRTSQS
jgi:hypothetical protein